MVSGSLIQTLTTDEVSEDRFSSQLSEKEQACIIQIYRGRVEIPF